MWGDLIGDQFKFDPRGAHSTAALLSALTARGVRITMRLSPFYKNKLPQLFICVAYYSMLNNNFYFRTSIQTSLETKKSK